MQHKYPYQKSQDNSRDTLLKENGWQVIRISNNMLTRKTSKEQLDVFKQRLNEQYPSLSLFSDANPRSANSAREKGAGRGKGTDQGRGKEAAKGNRPNLCSSSENSNREKGSGKGARGWSRNGGRGRPS